MPSLVVRIVLFRRLAPLRLIHLRSERCREQPVDLHVLPTVHRAILVEAERVPKLAAGAHDRGRAQQRQSPLERLGSLIPRVAHLPICRGRATRPRAAASLPVEAVKAVEAVHILVRVHVLRGSVVTLRQWQRHAELDREVQRLRARLPVRSAVLAPQGPLDVAHADGVFGDGVLNLAR